MFYSENSFKFCFSIELIGLSSSCFVEMPFFKWYIRFCLRKEFLFLVSEEELGHLPLSVRHGSVLDLLGHEGGVPLVGGQAHGLELGGALDSILFLVVALQLLLGAEVDFGFLNIERKTGIWLPRFTFYENICK
jgi:hypothetical protein